MNDTALASRERPRTEVMEAPPAPPPATHEAAMLQMIERIIRDPSIDIERVKAVLDMKKEIDQEAAKKLWAEAMSKAQAEMRSIGVDRENSQTHSKYASYAAIDKAIRPIYTKHGFSLVFDTADSPLPDHTRIICDVSCAGYTRRFHRDLDATGKGARGNDVMTKMHAAGSADTYGQRYLVKGIFNLAISIVPGRNDDDDGNAASGAKYLTEEQVERLQQCVIDAGASLPRLMAFLDKKLGAKALGDIPAAKFDDVVEVVRIMGEQAKARTAQ